MINDKTGDDGDVFPMHYAIANLKAGLLRMPELVNAHWKAFTKQINDAKKNKKRNRDGEAIAGQAADPTAVTEID